MPKPSSKPAPSASRATSSRAAVPSRAATPSRAAAPSRGKPMPPALRAKLLNAMNKRRSLTRSPDARRASRVGRKPMR